MSGPSADFAAEKDRDSRQSPARVVRGTALATATFPPLPRPSVFRSSFSDRPTALRVKLNREEGDSRDSERGRRGEGDLGDGGGRVAIACKTTCKGRAGEREKNQTSVWLRCACMQREEGSCRAGDVRLVIICFRVSDPDNGKHGGRRTERSRECQWHLAEWGKVVFPARHGAVQIGSPQNTLTSTSSFKWSRFPSLLPLYLCM